LHVTGAYCVFCSGTHNCEMNLVLTTELSATVTYRIHPLWHSFRTVDQVGVAQPMGFVILFEINKIHFT
jgi:hypothetical protein